MKIVTIGGGSSYTPELAEGLIKRWQILGLSEYWLVDIKDGEKKQEINAALIRRMIEKAEVVIKVFTTLNRKEALVGADFVTTQFRVGGLDAREKDELIPLSNGMLGQETNGAGGMFKAFRTIPVLLDICKEVNELCPNAFIINFTNPSGIVTEAMLKYGEHKKFIGLCNVPLNMERNVAKVLNVEPSRVRVTFAGLNHLVHGVSIYLDGEEYTKQALNAVYDPKAQKDPTVKNIIPVDYDKTFIDGLGVLICPYHNYFYKAKFMLDEQLKEYKNNNVRAQAVKKIETELFKIYSDASLYEKPKLLEDRGGAYYSEAACRLLESLHTDKKDIQPVDTMNNGAISSLDDNNVVEVSSIITKDGPIPLTIGRLPLAVEGLVKSIKVFETLTVEAAMEGSYEKAVLALTVHPLTTDDKVARKVVDQLMEAHKPYLSAFFK